MKSSEIGDTLYKAKRTAHLIPKKIIVVRGGKSYQTTVWVRPDDKIVGEARPVVAGDNTNKTYSPGQRPKPDPAKQEALRLKKIKKFLYDYYYMEGGCRVHENRELSFKKLPYSLQDSKTALKVYESHGGRFGPNWYAPSEYYLDIYDGNVIYIRNSDHWGKFSVLKYVDEYDDDLGYERFVEYNWTLEGWKKPERLEPWREDDRKAGYLVLGPAPEFK